MAEEPTTEPKADPAVKLYTADELAAHNTTEDCWMAIDGKVYDVTKFLDDHPGGGDVMVSSSGRDASDDFEDVGHSRHARKMMEEYLIGDFEGGRASKSAKASEGSGLGVLLPILVVLIAFAVYYMKSLNP